MKKYWRWFGPALCAALMTVGSLYAAEGVIRTDSEASLDKDPRVRFEAAQDDSHYLAGAVPVEDGKVVFRREIPLAGLSQQEIFDKVKGWLSQPRKEDKDVILDRLITYENRDEGIIRVESREYLVFAASALALDRAQFAVSQQYTCLPGKCIVTLEQLRYHYDNQNKVAEGWITDDYALNKEKTLIYKGVRKMRVKTVDWVDDLFAGLTSNFTISQVSAPVAQQLAATTVPAATLTPATPVAPVAVSAPPGAAVPFSVAETPLAPVSGQVGELAGYKRIEPEKIPGNIIKMLNDDWMLITAGTSAKFNMMTASWGGLGVLFGKPSAFCFVSPLRYTYSLLEQGDTYTLSFYTEAYRDALKLCGSVSGKDTDKVKATGLTPVTTPSGAQAFSEAWMIVECRKMVVQPLSQSVIVDPAVRGQFDGKPVNTMFVGEILNVWIK